EDDGVRRAGPDRARQRDPDDPPREQAVVINPPRPNGYRDAWCGQLTGERADTEARVAGWVNARRDHGGLIFIDLRDRSGVVQLVFNPTHKAAAHEVAGSVRSEFFLAA